MGDFAKVGSPYDVKPAAATNGNGGGAWGSSWFSGRNAQEPTNAAANGSAWGTNNAMRDIPLDDEAAPVTVDPKASAAAAGAFTYGGAYTAQTGGANIEMTDNASYDARLRNLERREAEVARREAALATGGSTSNWPRCCPVVYHNINERVPPERILLAKAGYLTWCITAAGYIWNWITITSMFIAGAGAGLSTFFYASLIAVVGLPASFFAWYYWGFYTSMISGGFISSMWFYLNFLVAIAWAVITIIGIKWPVKGLAGVLLMINQWDGTKGVVFGIFCIINIAIWGLAVLFSLYILGAHFASFRNHRDDGRERTNYTEKFMTAVFRDAARQQAAATASTARDTAHGRV